MTTVTMINKPIEAVIFGELQDGDLFTFFPGVGGCNEIWIKTSSGGCALALSRDRATSYVRADSKIRRIKSITAVAEGD
jgi:hypothetical protein